MGANRNLDKYKILLSTFETEDGMQYAAEFREFEFCSGGGDTPEEAISEAKKNLAIYIEELEEEGKPVPLPFKDGDEGYSGKFTLRMSKNLHKKIAELATTEGVSINSLIVEAVAEYVGGVPVKNTAL